MRNRVDQLGVAEPEIQTSGGNQITVGLPNVSDTARAEAEVGTTAQLSFYDWEANALTPNGKTVASQLQTQDPTAVQISQGGTAQAPGHAGGGEHGPVRRGDARLQAAGAGRATPTRASARSTACSARPGARPAPRRPRTRARCPSPASTACSPGPTTTGRPAVGPARGRERVRGPDPGRAAGNRGAPGDPHELLQADPDRRSERPVLRAQGRRRAARQRDHQPAAEHRLQTGAPDVTFGFTSKGQNEFQNDHRQDRPPRRPRQRPRADAQPALRGRARQPADHGPVRSTSSSIRTGSTAATAPTSAAASRSTRRRTSRTSCASARCRSTSS